MPPNTYFFNPLIAKFGITKSKTTCLLDLDETNDEAIKDIFYFKICKEEVKFTPVIKNNINSFFFLKYIYNLKTYDDVINWINNNNVSYHTIIRLLNCSWISFYDDMILKFDDTLKLYRNIIDKYIKNKIDVNKKIFTSENNYNIIIDRTIKIIAKKAKTAITYDNLHDNLEEIIVKYSNKIYSKIKRK
jgi:hypothetical protein